MTKRFSGDAGTWQLRASAQLIKFPLKGQDSYAITNGAACGKKTPPPPPPPLPVQDDASWFARGVAAYTGLNRTDPEAIWSFQGWAFVGWSSAKQRNSLKSFIDATPKGEYSSTLLY